jgi:hypothetical protein
MQDLELYHFRPAPAVGCAAWGATGRCVQVKLWDVHENTPKLVASQDLGVGAVFTVGVPSDAAHLVAAGGAKGEVAVWDLQQHEKLKRAYKKYFKDVRAQRV